MLLLTCKEDFLQQHPRVLVATLCFQEHPHRSLQILHAAIFQVIRSAYMLLCVLSTTVNQEAQELLDEIQQQPGVFVLSGPAVAITNVGTANELLADGWSTSDFFPATIHELEEDTNPTEKIEVRVKHRNAQLVQS